MRASAGSCLASQVAAGDKLFSSAIASADEAGPPRFIASEFESNELAEALAGDVDKVAAKFHAASVFYVPDSCNFWRKL
jgi:hypothetical protein